MKKKVLSPKRLVSLGRIAELSGLERSNGTLTLGACVTVSDIAASEAIAKAVSALGQGARALGTPLIRNLATVGGNIGSARPAADSKNAIFRRATVSFCELWSARVLQRIRLTHPQSLP
jgi:carbon-monoxide dehydrogenase medium subunit